jgi:hypothetical protein
MEHLLRAWRIAARLADRLGVAEEQRDALFYVAMLSWVGLRRRRSGGLGVLR